MKFLIISDFFLDELKFGGGAEYNDKELFLELKKKFEVDFVRSSEVSINFLENLSSNTKLIISNFVLLTKECIEFIQNKKEYIIYEHDHKYLKNRNPVHFYNFKAKKDEIINYNFYKNSKKIFCQSNFHKKIIETNLELNNIHSISGNFWSDKDLELIENIRIETNKEDRASIMLSDNWNKNSAGAINYCKKNNLDYQLIQDSNYESFLRKICSNKYFVFLPLSPETLSRVCVESRMLGCSTVTNNLVGAKTEDWYKLAPEQIIQYMRSKKLEIINEIEKAFQ